MKAFLLYKDKDFNWEQELTSKTIETFNDLELDPVFMAMAGGDQEIYENVKKVIAVMLDQAEEIRYRQEILTDCMNNAWIFEELNGILNRIEEQQNRLNRRFGFLKDYPTSLMSISLNMLEVFLSECRKLRNIVDRRSRNFHSEGFKRLFDQIREELNDDFFSRVSEHIDNCRFQEGMLVTTSIGPGLKANDYSISAQEKDFRGWLTKLLDKKDKSYIIRIKDRNENEARAFSDLKEKILNSTANVLMQSVEHISNFFKVLQKELSFYQGCLNLKQKLDQRGIALCYPTFVEPEESNQSFSDLSDVSLSLIKRQVVGNSCNLNNFPIIIITGANQGGKTTFLRSLGQAIVLSQSGMFVTAASYQSRLYSEVRTYFRRMEDRDNQSGKLDEELSRMQKIIRTIKPDSCLLLNEPFASTNEHEGSQIGWEILRALADSGIRIFCVTHFYQLTQSFNESEYKVLFLRAERMSDGTRTFKIVEEKPLDTGYGYDLYKKIFNVE